MADTPAADIHIAAMTVRGPGLSQASGVALAVAGAVARQRGEGASIARLTVQLQAGVLAADGGIDDGAIRDAIGRGGRARDA